MRNAPAFGSRPGPILSICLGRKRIWSIDVGNRGKRRKPQCHRTVRGKGQHNIPNSRFPERSKAYLIEVAIVAAAKHVVDLLANLLTLLEVETGEMLASLVVLGGERPVEVLAISLVDDIHFMRFEGRRGVEVILVADQVSQGGHRVVENDVLARKLVA